MFHFLVTGKHDGWENGFYLFDRSRFLEYTNDKIASKFKVKELTNAHIKRLMSWPCLFAYEGEGHDFRVGRLTGIKEDRFSIRIEFEFDVEIPPIPYDDIRPFAPLLDIRDWEMNRTHWAIKDEALFERLRAHNLLKEAPPAEPSDQAASVENLPENPSPPPITTVQAFIQQVLQSQVEREEVFYRGHSNSGTYKLEPSLFRKDAKGNYRYLQAEHMLYRELLVSNSIDFHGDNYTLDRLIRMQHYSLPTRLLDITSNPLIALYFACRSNLDALGEVIIITVATDEIKYFDSDTASCIANLARLNMIDKEAINTTLTEAEFNVQTPIQRLIHFVKEEKSFFEPRIHPEHIGTILCVKGKRSNDRISSQSGAFLLFGLDAELDENGTSEISVKRIAVSDKTGILRQLDLLNINESTVFPYIENSAKYVAQKYAFREAPSTPISP